MDFSFVTLMEITAALIMMYLVVANAGNFSVAIGAASQAYNSAVVALQGR